MAFNEHISEQMIEQIYDAPARRRKKIGDTLTNFVDNLGKPNGLLDRSSKAPRKSTLLEDAKRLLGADTGTHVIHPEFLTKLIPTFGEERQRDRNIALMNNTARARQIVLEERLREQRKRDALIKKQQKFEWAREQWLINEMNQTIGDTNQLNQHSTGFWNEAQKRHDMRQKGQVPDWNPVVQKEE